jgi:hypothetical protein
MVDISVGNGNGILMGYYWDDYGIYPPAIKRGRL